MCVREMEGGREGGSLLKRILRCQYLDSFELHCSIFELSVFRSFLSEDLLILGIFFPNLLKCSVSERDPF